MSQDSRDSLEFSPGPALGKRKSTPSSRYGDGSPFVDSDGWASGRAASAGGSGRMSNPIALDMSGSVLNVSGSSSVLREGVVAPEHEGEDEVDGGYEDSADEEGSSSGGSVKEVKAGGKAKSGKGQVSDQDSFTNTRAMGRPGEWESCFLAIGKHTPWGERSDALRPGVWLRDPVDKAQLAATVERGWNRRRNALEKEEKDAAKLTGEGTMTQGEESELYARDSEKYQLMVSIKLQHAAKQQAMKGDAVAKEQEAAAKAERNRAAYGGGSTRSSAPSAGGGRRGLSARTGGGDATTSASATGSARRGAPGTGRGSRGGGRGGGSTASGRGMSSDAAGAVGRGRASARGIRHGSGAGAGSGGGTRGRGRASPLEGSYDFVTQRGVLSEEQADEYFAPRAGSAGVREQELDEDVEGDYDDGDQSSESWCEHVDGGSHGSSQLELDDAEATNLSAGNAGRKVRSGKGGGPRKQTYRGTPGGVSGGRSEIVDLMRMAVTKLVNRPNNPQQQPAASADLDSLRAQVAQNTLLAQSSHDMAQQSLQQSQQGCSGVPGGCSACGGDSPSSSPRLQFTTWGG
eukprot:g15057.t1